MLISEALSRLRSTTIVECQRRCTYGEPAIRHSTAYSLHAASCPRLDIPFLVLPLGIGTGKFELTEHTSAAPLTFPMLPFQV